MSVDLAAGSVTGSLPAPSVDAAGYVDAAQSTVHGHFQPSPAAVAAGFTDDHAPSEASLYVNTALPASYVPSTSADVAAGSANVPAHVESSTSVKTAMLAHSALCSICHCSSMYCCSLFLPCKQMSIEDDLPSILASRSSISSKSRGRAIFENEVTS